MSASSHPIWLMERMSTGSYALSTIPTSPLIIGAPKSEDTANIAQI